MLDSVYSPIDAFLRGIGLLGRYALGSRQEHALSRQSRSGAAFGPLRACLAHVAIGDHHPAGRVDLHSADIKDAADVDGASYWRQFFKIRVPLLLPIMAVAVLYGIVFTFTDMTVVYILTRGGPLDQTQVLASWAFYKGVQGTDLAQGAAIALFLFPVLVVAAIVMLRLARRTETV
ncbi:MAG: sugar ABC transporter permease [Thermomicrobiales bacterium]